MLGAQDIVCLDLILGLTDNSRKTKLKQAFVSAESLLLRLNILDMVHKFHNVLPEEIWLLESSKMSSLVLETPVSLYLSSQVPVRSATLWKGAD